MIVVELLEMGNTESWVPGYQDEICPHMWEQKRERVLNYCSVHHYARYLQLKPDGRTSFYQGLKSNIQYHSQASGRAGLLRFALDLYPPLFGWWTLRLIQSKDMDRETILPTVKFSRLQTTDWIHYTPLVQLNLNKLCAVISLTPGTHNAPIPIKSKKYWKLYFLCS